MEQLPNDYLSSEGELQITQETSGYLIETSKWAKFIAITFYIVMGLLILIMFGFGSYFFNSFGSYRNRIAEDGMVVAIIVIIIAAVVVGVTYYFLILFANKIRAGIEGENIEQVNAGLGALKVHFIIVGVILILGILVQLYSLSIKY